MLKTLRTNWRDIVLFLVVGLGLALAAAFVDYLSTRFGLGSWAAVIANYFKGFSMFVGANFAAIFFGLCAWPTINNFGNTEFHVGWGEFNRKEKTIVYMAVLFAEGLVAAICFAGAN
jgi:hypothetical protein